MLRKGSDGYTRGRSGVLLIVSKGYKERPEQRLFALFVMGLKGGGVSVIHPDEIYRSKDHKRSGDNKNAILWTPLLTPFAKMDTFGPKRPGFLLYGGED